MKSILTNEEPPKCFIRIDRSHFVRSLFRNQELKKMDTRKSDFFRSVFGYLIKCDSIQEVEKIAEDLFIIICSKFANKYVLESKNRLVSLISTHEFMSDNNTHPEDDGGDIKELLEGQGEITSYKKTASFIWINSIYESAAQRCHDQSNSSKCVENLFYTSSQGSIRFFLRTLCRIPLWSNIMNGKFKSGSDCATSSGSESEFKNIKKLLASRPCKVDKFVKLHLTHLSGHLKLALSDQRKSKLPASRLAEAFKCSKPNQKQSNRKRARLVSSSSSGTSSPQKRTSSPSAVQIKRKKIHRSCSDLSLLTNESPQPMKTNKSFESQPNLSISSTDWPADELSAKQKRARKIRSSSIDSFETSNKLESSQIMQGENQLSLASDSFQTSLFSDVDINESCANKPENDTSLDSLCDKVTDENWGNKNKKEAFKKGRSRHSILEPHNLRRNRAAVPLLKNGYSSKRNGLVTVSTCGFDAIFSVFASAFADFDSVEKLIDEKSTENLFFALIKNAFETRGHNIPVQIYEDRNSLLKKIYECDDYFGQRNQTKNLLFIDCEVGIGGLFSRLIKETGADLASAVRYEQCKCSNKQPRVDSFIELNQRGLQLSDLNKYISHEAYQDKTTTCKTCKSAKKSNFVFSEIICFEVEPISRHSDNKIGMRQLTQQVTISNKTYRLFGVIERKTGINHFIAYVKRREFWQTFDDLQTSLPKQSYYAESQKLLTRIISPYMLFFIDESIQNS